MNLTIACSGAVSRALHLAEYFAGRDELHELHIPTYARKNPQAARVMSRALEVQDIPEQFVRTHPTAGLVRRWTQQRGDLADPAKNLAWQRRLDQATAATMSPGADILLTESMVSLDTLARGREFGMSTVLDRTNTHIRYQQRLVSDENEAVGLGPVELHSAEGIARAEAEYDAADRICTLSSFARDSFIEMGIAPDKLLLVPSATDLTAFKPMPKEDDVFRVVMVGYASLKKGTHRLLEAWADLDLPNSELVLVGGMDPALEPLIAPYEGTYRRAGFIPHSELPALLSQASVFALPSLEEGMAKVVLEAMACGVPVVVTPNTGAADVARDGEDGFIVPAGDAAPIAEALKTLHDDPVLRERMGRSARERVSTGWSWADYGARMREALLSVLD